MSFLKFFATFYALFAVYQYVLPDWVAGNLLSVVTWFFMFLMCYGFATWALHPYAPSDRDMATLAIVWLAVTVLLLLWYGMFLSFRGSGILVEREIVIQLIVEIAAIILAGFMMRRRRLKRQFAEKEMTVIRSRNA